MLSERLLCLSHQRRLSSFQHEFYITPYNDATQHISPRAAAAVGTVFRCCITMLAAIVFHSSMMSTCWCALLQIPTINRFENAVRSILYKELYSYIGLTGIFPPVCFPCFFSPNVFPVFGSVYLVTVTAGWIRSGSANLR